MRAIRSMHAIRLTVCFATVASYFSGGGAFAAPREEALVSAARFESIPARVVARVPVPKGYHEGLHWDGQLLWLANGEGGDIWRIDPATGAVLSTIRPIATFTEALSGYAEDRFYVSDWDTRTLYRARLEGDELVPESSISFGKAHPAGIIWTGSRLFALAWTRGMGTKFELVELDGSLKILKRYRIHRIQEPCQLAWDGTYLWISSWYSRRVYKVDVDTMTILGSFRSPVELTTGIAWDGTHLWLTGTHSDLYRLELGAGEVDREPREPSADAGE